MPGILLHENPAEHEFPRLVAIWRSAVDATHDFLASGDRDAIERALIPDYFPAVHLVSAKLDGQTVGFSGVADGNLEMLFVDDAFRGRGVGGRLLAHAIAERGVRRVDVNEQNTQAVAFYDHAGFRVRDRSETDEAGRPYPILHLELVQ